MDGYVVACTKNARDAYALLLGSAAIARRLNAPLILMLSVDPDETQPVALEYAYQCARRFDAELEAYSGERALGRLFAAAHRRSVRCVITKDDPALLSRVRLAFGGVQALDVSCEIERQYALPSGI